MHWVRLVKGFLSATQTGHSVRAICGRKGVSGWFRLWTKYRASAASTNAHLIRLGGEEIMLSILYGALTRLEGASWSNDVIHLDADLTSSRPWPEAIARIDNWAKIGLHSTTA